MNDALRGRFEHALIGMVLALLFFAARWTFARAIPASLSRAVTPRRLRVALMSLILVPPLVAFGVLQVSRLTATSAETATTSQGWHVVSGELFHDGKRDEEGTARMQDEIAAINMREDQADGVVDQWATTRKDAMAVGFQAQRNAVYGSYEAHRP